MAEEKPLLVCAAAYETVDAALADLESIELAHMQATTDQITSELQEAFQS